MLNTSTGHIDKEALEHAIHQRLGFIRLAQYFDTTEYVISKHTKLYWGTGRLSEVRKLLGVPGPLQ